MFYESLAPRGRVHRAFSLIEMMVVLVLLGLLAGLVSMNVRHVLLKGKQNAAKTQLNNIRQALETFHAMTGRYPTNEEGLAKLVEKNDQFPEPLMSRIPLDPWQRPYEYNQPGRNTEPYEVITFGADGRAGGTGEDTDISSSDLGESQVINKTGATH